MLHRMERMGKGWDFGNTNGFEVVELPLDWEPGAGGSCISVARDWVIV